MKMTKQIKNVSSASTVALSLFVSAQATSLPSWVNKGDTIEKCLGVAAKGQNDCGSKNKAHSCGGMAKKDNDPSEWLWTPEGLCSKLGGSVWKTRTAKKDGDGSMH